MATVAKPRVLVVEDEPELAQLYAAWLANNYEVQIANRGEVALEKLDTGVDVVLLDRRIPDRAGDEILQELRGQGFDCQVAMVSAVSPEADIVEMGFDDYLVKPVRRQDFIEVVERLTWRSRHTEDVQEFLALASKKAVLDAQNSPAERDSSQAYAALERELREKFNAIEASLEGLENQDIEAVVDDLRQEVTSVLTR